MRQGKAMQSALMNRLILGLNPSGDLWETVNHVSELYHLRRQREEGGFQFPLIPFLQWLSAVLETATAQLLWSAVHTDSACHRIPAEMGHRCLPKEVIRERGESECPGDTGRAVTAYATIRWRAGQCPAQIPLHDRTAAWLENGQLTASCCSFLLDPPQMQS